MEVFLSGYDWANVAYDLPIGLFISFCVNRGVRRLCEVFHPAEDS